jgi:excisionase family DNA binding protein
VARRLGISIPTVQRWVDAGRLTAWKTPGGHRRIEAESADQLFDMRHAGAATTTGRPSLIVVEDNADDRELLLALLEQLLPDVQVSAFDNAVQALVAIGSTAPDILVSDVVMPDMNGLAMLRRLASQCVVRPAVIVVVTSLSDREIARLGGLPEGVRLVRKPVEPEQFSKALGLIG